MSTETPPLFGKTRFFEGQINEFMDKIAGGAIFYEKGMLMMTESEINLEACEEKLEQITAAKRRCNELRRSISTSLYSEMLIPDFRGDVLNLLNDMFSLLDVMGSSFQQFTIEIPHQRDNLTWQEEFIAKKEFVEMVRNVVQSVESAVVAARAFFRDPATVNDRVYEVRLYESEADKIAIRLKKSIFGSDLPLDRKIQLRDAIDVLDNLADLAEDVGDELSIYAIKRAL